MWGDTNEGNICPLPHRRRVGLEVADGSSELKPLSRAARRQVLFASLHKIKPSNQRSKLERTYHVLLAFSLRLCEGTSVVSVSKSKIMTDNKEKWNAQPNPSILCKYSRRTRVSNYTGVTNPKRRAPHRTVHQDIIH